ncbi:MAG: peptidoglycan editing factor PgeF [Clostridium sp.]|uniref:peptidoglycan editing factor PgeF n=1 Tax=Clostridium sp. TaxID=1506 RepID=UPI002FC844C4
MSKFNIVKKGSLEYIQSKSLLNEGIKHFFSTKNGGVSEGEFESLNLGVYTNDNKDNVKENFNIILRECNMSSSIAYLHQVHGQDVYLVNRDNVDQVVGKDGDAIITAEKNLPIGVFTADCVPILLYDKNKKVVAAIHAGWRGVVGKILTKTISKMKQEFKTSSEDIVVAIGPFIGSCCFEVSADIINKFNFYEIRGNKYFVDLYKEVEKEALENNILLDNIDFLDMCSVCTGEIFHSYRRQSGKTGRIGSFIEIS